MPDGSEIFSLPGTRACSAEDEPERFPFDRRNWWRIFEDQDQDAKATRLHSRRRPGEHQIRSTSPADDRDADADGRVASVSTNFGETKEPDRNTRGSSIPLPVTRDVLPYMVKIMLPILIVILITALICVLPARFRGRTGIGTQPPC